MMLDKIYERAIWQEEERKLVLFHVRMMLVLISIASVAFPMTLPNRGATLAIRGISTFPDRILMSV